MRIEPPKPAEIKSLEPPVALTTGSTIVIETQHFPNKVLTDQSIQVILLGTVLTAKVSGSKVKCNTPSGVMPGNADLQLLVTSHGKVTSLNATLVIQSPILHDPKVMPAYGAAGTTVLISQDKFADWYVNVADLRNQLSVFFLISGQTYPMVFKSPMVRKGTRLVTATVPLLPLTVETTVEGLVMSSGQVTTLHQAASHVSL